MRILLVAHQFPPYIGGMQSFSYMLASELAKRHEVAVMCRAPSGSIKSAFRVVPWLTGVYEVDESAVLGYLSRYHVDIVHILNAGFAPIIGKLKGMGIPVVVTAHGKDFLDPFIFGKGRNAVVSSLKETGRVVAISSVTKRQLADVGVKKNVVTIWNATNPRIFRPGHKDKLLLARHNIPESATVLLTVCRISRKKNIESVIQILPFFPNAFFIVVGPVVEKDYYGRLRKLVVQLSVSDRVVFAGSVDPPRSPGDNALVRYYNSCDIFVMPSRALKGDIEGFGLVFLEALSCGKPVVVSESSGGADIVKKYKVGFAVSQRRLAGRISMLLKRPGLSSSMGRKGREMVKREFSWDSYVRELDKVYKGVAKFL